MTEQLTAEHLAKTFGAAARVNYENDRHLTPVVHMIDKLGGGVALIPNPDRFEGQPREQLASLVSMTADIVDICFVATITEAWMKRFPDHSGGKEPPDLERGQLSRESETDPTIHTTAMVQVLDMRRLEDSFAVMSTVEPGDPRTIEWDIAEISGKPEGGLPDYVIRGYWIAKSGLMPVDHSHTIEERLRFLGEIGFIVGGMATIIEPIEGSTDGS